MTKPAFQQAQYNFAGHLRDPENIPAPAAIEDRRMGIYRDLIYNNIENFIANGFPVLREITDDDQWHSLVRDFIANHQSQSPYFLEISQEFLKYLQETRKPEPNDPPFLHELAHYEWVELALDVAEGEIPPNQNLSGDVLANLVEVSPLVWSLSYQYPVHKISRTYQPTEPVDGGVFLLVYRNRHDVVGFFEINGLTALLIQKLQQQGMTAREALEQVGNEIAYPDIEALLNFGQGLVSNLLERDVLILS